MNQLILFDYQDLDAETRIVVQQRTSEIKALMKRTAQDIIEIGEKLTDVRNRLVGNGNGGFEGWLRLEFDWGKTTAYRFINVAESFNRSNLERLDFAPSALYLLAAPSTPDDARAEAIERAEAGERITHSAAKAIVEGYKPAPAVIEHSVPVLDFQHAELLRPVEELEATPAWLQDDDAGEDIPASVGPAFAAGLTEGFQAMTETQAAAGLDRLAADLAAYTPAEVGETEMMTGAENGTEPDETQGPIVAEPVAANGSQPETELSSSAPALPVPPPPVPAPAPTPPPPPVVRAAPWVASISVPDGDAPALLTILHGSTPKSMLPADVARRMIAAIEARIEPAAAVLDVPDGVPVMAPDWLIPRSR